MTGSLQNPANPYVGPRAFQQGERLYGRDLEVMQLLHLLMAERIVLFYSPSGAGKTSLIQAALIPRLEEEGFQILPPMRVSLVPPPDEQVDRSSNRYIVSLLLSLEEALVPEERTPLTELSTLTLAEYLDRRQDSDEAVGTVLIFDQFEEILTLDPIDRELKLEFFAQVGAALRDRGRWALFAMREEFIAGLEEPYLRPVPTRLRTSYRLGLLDPKHARQAIQEPAKAAGVTFTDAAAGKLVSDLSTVRLLQPDGSMRERPGPYVEPVQLQVVCRRLWALLPGGASQVAEEDIERLADVDLALSGYYADQVKAAARGTHVAEKSIRNWFDRELITEQGIRGQVLKGPKESEGLDNQAIEPLVDAHLVRAEKRRGATWFELAHDRLIEPVQANNAAWRQARLIRWAAVVGTLLAILAIALALAAGSAGGLAAANDAKTAAAGTAIAAEGTATAAEGTATAAEGKAALAEAQVITAETAVEQARDAAEGTAIAAEGSATAAKATAIVAETAAEQARGTAIVAEATATAAKATVMAAETAAQQERGAALAAEATATAAEATAVAAETAAGQERDAYAAAQATIAGLETQLASCAAITPTATSTQTPAPKPIRIPTPTVTVTPGLACSVEAQSPFAWVWQSYRPRLGCPREETPTAIEDAEQAFQNGRMVWQRDPTQIYVIYEGGDRAGTYQTYLNGQLEGNGPVCPYPCEASPPEGFFPPERGFLDTWCRLCGEDSAIGWGLGGERGFASSPGGPLIQVFERGLIFRDGAGRIYVLFADRTFVQVQ